MVVLLCCFSSYSLAYDQQYQVGGTGPQGGTVTEVTVSSVLDSTTTQQVGDNLETVTVTKFTETIIENVTSTQQVTQTTINTTETSTGDIITGTNLNRSGINSPADAKVNCLYGSGSGFYRDASGCGRHTHAWDDLHIKTEGQHQYTTDTDHWMNQESLNYGFDATATAQGRDSSPSNTQFSITVKLYDPDTGANTQETNTWTLTNSYQTFSTTLEVGTNTYGANSQLIATYLGIDPNYDGYGWDTDIQNFNLSLTYNVLETVVETINQTITNSIQSAIDTLESQTSLVYNPLIQPGTDQTSIPVIETPTANQDSFTVNVAGNQGGGVQLVFNVEVDETANVATVEMASTNLETGVVTIDEVANISLDFSADSGGTTATTEMVNVAEVETQVAATVETAVAEVQVAEATTESTATTETTTESTETTTETTTETESTETNTSEGESNETSETVQESSSDVEEQVADSGEMSSNEATGSDKSESADKSGSNKDSKSKTKLTKEQKREKIEKEVAKAKQKIANKILRAMADTYSALNEATKIALMASLTDTESFKAYQKKNNEDLANWYSDIQAYADMPQLIDPAASLFERANDKIMNEMIDQQYK